MLKINGVAVTRRDDGPAGFGPVNGPAFRAACDEWLAKRGLGDQWKDARWGLYGGRKKVVRVEGEGETTT